jgi:hypothetical protein
VSVVRWHELRCDGCGRTGPGGPYRTPTEARKIARREQGWRREALGAAMDISRDGVGEDLCADCAQARKVTS